MKRHVIAAVFLLGGMSVVAQSDAPAAAPQDPQAAYTKLAREFSKAMAAYQEDYEARKKAAADEGKPLPRSAYRPPTKEYIGTAQELAREYQGKDEAVMFLGFILKNARTERNAVKWAVKTLASDHADSKAIGDVIDYVAMMQRVAGRSARVLLNQVADKHADRDVRAKALLARATATIQRDASAAIGDLEKVLTLTKDEDMLAEANEALTEARKFAVGATAPEIVGVDVDGVAFKLSDYRGKVVLLDFWGFW